MGRGDHIYVDYGTYTHHGIDCGDGTAIHYRKSNSTISRTPMAEFTNGKQLLFKHYRKRNLPDFNLPDFNLLDFDLPDCDLPDIVIQRAESRLGENGYCLFGNNCEHFATWCKTGNHRSEQVNNVVGGTGTTVGAVAGTAGAVGAVAAAGSVAAVGATVGGGMVAGVAVTVAAPAVAAAAVGYGAYKLWQWITE